MENNFDYQGAKQAGYSDQEIQNYLASKQPQQQPQQQETGGGNILSNILPLIGGTVGSIGGSFLDPFLGPLGTIGGGAAGAGAGQWISDILQNKQPTVQDVGGQVVGGGIGGGIGKMLGPLFGLGGKMLSKAPQALDEAGTNVINSQFNLPRSAAQKLLPGTTDKLYKYGITNINDMRAAAPVVTGPGGVVNEVKKALISKASPIDTAGVEQMAKDLLYTTNTTNDQKVLNFVRTQLKAMNGGAEGTMSPYASPSDVFKSIQQFEAKAHEIDHIPLINQSTEEKNTARLYNQMANELSTRLYKGETMLQPQGYTGEFAGETVPGGTDAMGNPTAPFTFPEASKIPVNITPAQGADNIVLHGNPIKPGTPEYETLAKISPVLANEAANAKTIADLRAIESGFTKASIAARITASGKNLGFKNIGNTGSDVANAIPSIADPLAPVRVIAGSDTVNAAAGGAMKKTAGVLSKIPMPSNISPLLAKLTGQAVGQGMEGSSSGPAQAETTSAIPNLASMQTPAVDSSVNPQDQKTDQLKQVLGYVMLSHAKTANDLIAAYNFMNPQNKQSEAARVDKVKANGILSLIQNMQNNVGNAKYIGPFGNLIQKAEQKTGFGGGGDQATNDLNQNMAILQQLIATEVHRRGMSEASLKTMYDAFPHSSDSHAAYVQKLNHLQDMMQTYFGDSSQ